MPSKSYCCCSKRDPQIASANKQTVNLSLEDIESIEPESDSLYGNQEDMRAPYSRQPPASAAITTNQLHNRTGTGLEDNTQVGFTEPKPTFQLSRLNVPSTKYSAVRAVLFSLSALFGESPEDLALKIDESFYEIGGNADNTLITIACLHHYKFKIGVLEFLRARNLREIALKMSPLGESESKLSLNELSKMYKARKTKGKDVEFLFRCLKYANVKQPDSFSDWTTVWRSILSKGKHVLCTRKLDNMPAGLVLNFDMSDEVHNRVVPIVTGASLTNVDIQRHSYEMSSKSILIELLQFVGDQSQKKGKIVHPIFLMADCLSEPERVSTMIFMEIYNIERLKVKGFKWIVTDFQTPLQAQIERQVLGFEILETTQKDGDKRTNSHPYIIATIKI